MKSKGNIKIIILSVIAVVVLILALIVYNNFRYEQSMDYGYYDDNVDTGTGYYLPNGQECMEIPDKCENTDYNAGWDTLEMVVEKELVPEYGYDTNGNKMTYTIESNFESLWDEGAFGEERNELCENANGELEGRAWYSINSFVENPITVNFEDGSKLEFNRFFIKSWDRAIIPENKGHEEHERLDATVKCQFNGIYKYILPDGYVEEENKVTDILSDGNTYYLEWNWQGDRHLYWGDYILCGCGK